jgi:hypothetical protein
MTTGTREQTESNIRLEKVPPFRRLLQTMPDPPASYIKFITLPHPIQSWKEVIANRRNKMSLVAQDLKSRHLQFVKIIIFVSLCETVTLKKAAVRRDNTESGYYLVELIFAIGTLFSNTSQARSLWNCLLGHTFTVLNIMPTLFWVEGRTAIRQSSLLVHVHYLVTTSGQGVITNKESEI